MKKNLICLIAIICCLTAAQAQELTPYKIKTVVQGVSEKLENHYPFPEISAQYAKMLRKNMDLYTKINDRQVLADRLIQDLRAVHKDVHLYIGVEPAKGEPSLLNDDDLAKNNYGFKSVELDNTTSTAYISIPYGFNCTQEGFDMAGHAMNMAAYSNNVIIDIRGNGGGAGGMGHFLASYFYEPGQEIFYLDAFEKEKKNIQEFTFGYVPGKHLTHARLFILIDRNTASASEGFAFAMQKLKRATIIGETSAGAGIAGILVPVGEQFEMFLPVKMIVAPGTNEGWEGTGVIPDINTEGDDPLLVARKEILKAELALAAPEKKEMWQWKIDDMAIGTKVTAALLEEAKESYVELARRYSAKETIEYKGDKLYWIYTEPGKEILAYEMLPLMKDVYVINGLNKQLGMTSSRVYINRRADNKIKGLTRKTLLDNGSIVAREINLPEE